MFTYYVWVLVEKKKPKCSLKWTSRDRDKIRPSSSNQQFITISVLVCSCQSVRVCGVLGLIGAPWSWQALWWLAMTCKINDTVICAYTAVEWGSTGYHITDSRAVGILYKAFNKLWLACCWRLCCHLRQHHLTGWKHQHIDFVGRETAPHYLLRPAQCFSDWFYHSYNLGG